MKREEGGGHADRARILCADDDGRVLLSIAGMLTYTGYAVTTAVNGREAWMELQARHFDLLITDDEMPELDGAGLATRARLEHLTLPIIVMSGAPGFEAKFNGELFEDITLMRKPFTSAELLDAIEQVLGPAKAGGGS